jgi:hypothetical protein
MSFEWSRASARIFAFMASSIFSDDGATAIEAQSVQAQPSTAPMVLRCISDSPVAVAGARSRDAGANDGERYAQ